MLLINNTFKRHRRLRQSKSLRSLVRETQLSVDDFIYPLFIIEGKNIKKEVSSMPGVYQISLDNLKEELEEVVKLGIKAVLFFGVVENKDELGTNAYKKDGIVQKAIKHTKNYFPDLIVIADTCLCEYTSHGHCGIVEDGHIINDKSLRLHAKAAISQAEAGADIIAPSSMMDGFTRVIRKSLDQKCFSHIPIMSYAVKYASSFYGPFREAAESTPQFGDRKTYQMDPANRLEAFREAQSDIEEEADFLIVKPALSYLDIIRDLRNNTHVPIVAYSVSGEYSMLKAAENMGWLNTKEVMYESLLSMKRAGANLIITYFAKEIAKLLHESEL